ncbi:MAG: UDP-N-acetylmuramoyl-L-alanine--D-glutamate ligase [Clostridia bacterium]|nr:UDP-N-acetylmuramoyl-L-alanine--D-glutamate ligase [Clostridia bacterium]
MRVNFKGKNVLVYGMGTSGQSAAKLLHGEGACVSVYDDENRFGNFFPFETNPMTKKYDFVVVSPGVKVLGNKLISFFILSKTKVLSELDLAYLFNKGRIIGITGTNGKTTVTSLVGDIFKTAGKETFVCGNIGLPFCEVAKKTSKNSVVVCEVSNLQLELSSLFKADACTILNLAPDHIDRHGNFEEYVRVKKKILSGKKNQRVVLNFDDEIVRNLQINKKTLFFSKKILKKGVFLKNNAIYFNKTKIISLLDIPLFGEKNIENVMAAVALSVINKIKPAQIKESIMHFKAPSHRLEYLGEVGGAMVFDDSKATNIASSLGAINSVGERGLVLLLGGQNKDFQFDEIFNKGFAFEQLLCFGGCGKEIYDCAVRYGYSPMLFGSMKEAAVYAKENAKDGQKILLSPACASFDEFSSYAVRGQIFKEIMFGENEKIELQG